MNLDNNLFEKLDILKKLSTTECKNLLSQINIEQSLKQKNKNRVLNYILINYIKSKENTLDNLKREKIFSLNIYSKNKFIIKILDFLLKEAKNLEYIKLDFAYFTSKRNFAYFSEDIFLISQNIRKIIKQSDSGFVRSLLFLVDKSFFEVMNHKTTNTHLNSILEIQTISEVCSFLIFQYAQIHKIHTISEKTYNLLSDKDIFDLIYDVKVLQDFENMEKLIDNYNYQCVKFRNNLTINNPDNLFDMARLYGDDNSNIQRTNDTYNSIKRFQKSKKVVSYRSIIEKLPYKSFFEFIKEPIPRYILKFPNDKKIVDFLTKENFFLEKVIEFEEIHKEYGLPHDEILKFKISTTLTVKDLIIIKRIFLLMSYLNSEFLYPLLDKNESKQSAYNSWIKAFSKENLRVLMATYIGDTKAEEFINEFSWKIKNHERLDLQFTPLIQFDDYYFPMNIFAYSNLFRNLLYKNNIRPQNDTDNDLISQKIYKALRKKFELVNMEVRFNNSDFHGDFDVIAYIDNVIYVFECKNILTPVGLHELRTTFKDNIKKGFKQLDKCRNALLNDKFINYIKSNDKLGWSLSNDYEIVTCLVLGNRMFNGYTDGIHHVRSVHELENFILRGQIAVNNQNNIQKFNLWNDTNIEGDDLFNFIENRHFHKLIYKSFNSQKNKEKIGKYNLIFETNEFNIEDFHIKLKNKFKYVEDYHV